jgi:hypothetical protein
MAGYNPEDSQLHSHRRENLESYLLVLFTNGKKQLNTNISFNVGVTFFIYWFNV